MSTEPPILVIGSGGHAKVVVDAIRSNGPASIVVIDDAPGAQGRMLLGVPVSAPASATGHQGGFHVAIGDNDSRMRKTAELLGALSPRVVVHSRASVSSSSSIGAGAFLAAGCTLGPDCTIGAGVIVNHGAVVDHDCVVGEFAHVAPNATLGGGVSVGRLSMVGAGATVLPGTRIGQRCIIGAGAVVRRDVPDGTTVVGVPAKAIDR